jgi:hypothetical protein
MKIELESHALGIEGFLGGKEKARKSQGDEELQRKFDDLCGSIPYARKLLAHLLHEEVEHPVAELMETLPEDLQRFGEQSTGRKMLSLHVEIVGKKLDIPHRFHFKEVVDAPGFFEFSAET